jgi:hypothetical protein
MIAGGPGVTDGGRPAFRRAGFSATFWGITHGDGSMTIRLELGHE